MIKRKLINLIPDIIHIYLKGFFKLGYVPHLNNPRSFNEHILKLKINSDHTKLAKYADRIKVREYISQKSDACKLIPILWKGYDFKKDVWNTLPESFVIKANHGSGMVKVVDKRKDGFHEVKDLCDHWLNSDFHKVQREYVYDAVERIIIVEEKLTFEDDVPPDYKFFCFDGMAKFFQVDYSRFEEHKRNIFDKELNLIPVKYEYPIESNYKMSPTIQNGIEIAEKISNSFNFVRVDLYLLQDSIYFGEMTFFPEAGFGKFEPTEFDFQFGEYFNSQ
jgi:hypothetical protein